MVQIELTIRKLACMRCGHTWIPNSENLPRVCPLCHSPYWNKARVVHKAVAKKHDKKIPGSMFGVSPDLSKFEREEDDFRG